MDIYSDDWRTKCHLHRPYEHNVTVIKKFNDDYYKLITFRSLRKEGFLLDSDLNKNKKNSVNDKKLLNNIARARNTIFELSMCNDWQFFVTLTLSPDKLSILDLDRFDLKSFYKKFSKWLNNLPYKIDYLLVPEQHKNGAWHFHGFINGIPDDHLSLFNESDYLPYYILNKLNDGYLIYKWIDYANKFGFCDLEFIKNQEKCSSYVTKYISKELYKTINNLGYHCYYCSKGLKRSEKIFHDVLDKCIDYDFNDDYVSVKFCDKNYIDSLDVLC